MTLAVIFLFFVVTGITLNHQQWLPGAEPAEVTEVELPDQLAQDQRWQSAPLAMVPELQRYLAHEFAVAGSNVSVDWDQADRLMVINVKRPGGYSVAEIEPDAALLVLEDREYGFIAVINDLHKGRNSGLLWIIALDVFSLLMLVFLVTGVWLVVPQKKRRKMLFSLAGLGLVVTVGGYYLALI